MSSMTDGGPAVVLEVQREAPSRQSAELGRMPQLDTLRTVAVMGVIVAHTMLFPGHTLGAYGVTLFFVLSGFLITGILLQCRDLAHDGHARTTLLRQFYIRRFLRIFPLYYLVLAILWIAGYEPVREEAFWLFGYLTEFRVGQPGVAASAVSHFWSLAVEEQFYMIWPWVVLWAPARLLPRIIVGMILLAPVSRSIGAASGMTREALWAFPLCAMDALGLGALLAVALKEGWIRRLQHFALVAGMAATALLVLCRMAFPFGAEVLWTLGPVFLSGWLVASAARGFSGVFGKWMSWAPLLWVGSICYGIYIYHLPMVLLLQQSGYKGSDFIKFLAVTGMTIAVAAASWYAFERPINNLKRHFPYAVSGASRSRFAASVEAAPLRKSE